jgi:hypothetical protein
MPGNSKSEDSMKHRLRRDLRAMRGLALLNALAFVFLASAALRQRAASQTFDEITVQRLNVVDANGTLRLVASNKDRMHPGVMDGITIDRPRPVAGLIFFNDEGDEVGGLTVTGQEREGQRRANAILAFDQIKQDQTVAITYSETNGQRSAGLQVWDRSERRLSELIAKLNAANAIGDPAAREKAVQAARAEAPAGPRRVFVGKTTERAAVVSLADANGKPRLSLKVEADGAASIEFLDGDGKVVQRIPAPR